MKKIVDLNLEEFAQIVINDKEMKSRFSQYIYECEIEGYAGDKIACFERGCVDYEYGLCCHCFMRVKNDRHYDVLDGMKKSVDYYGCSERLQKFLNHAEKLLWTNLFRWYVEKALEIFFKEEVMPSIEWVEDMDYELHCGKMHDDLYDILDCFQDHFEGYLYDQENQTYYKPVKIA